MQQRRPQRFLAPEPAQNFSVPIQPEPGKDQLLALDPERRQKQCLLFRQGLRRFPKRHRRKPLLVLSLGFQYGHSPGHVLFSVKEPVQPAALEDPQLRLRALLRFLKGIAEQGR
ncbi:MAG: hypothetical protein EGQ60_09190 [Clostridiales bacterium]|nr:hypothetical protein [Clostridiales bacterium]